VEKKYPMEHRDGDNPAHGGRVRYNQTL